MKQILMSLHGKRYEQSLPQSHIDVKSATAKNRSNPSVKLLPEHEEENVFTPKPTLFVSTMLRISTINFFDNSPFLKRKMCVHTSRECIINLPEYLQLSMGMVNLEEINYSLLCYLAS